MARTIQQISFPAPMRPCLKRVAAYARVSSGKDAMLHSLSAQVSYYSALIQKHTGWLYCGVYADEAFTGTKDSRDGFQSLLAECRAGNIDMVITKSISRFARNTVTLLETVRELKALGVDVYFEEQNIHTMSADGELMMTILASYAQEESRSASENQKWRIRRGFERGELINLRFLFGYKIEKGRVAVDPEKAAVVREVFRRALEGASLTSLAIDLNRRGFTGVLGGKWNSMRIREMLSNETWNGTTAWQNGTKPPRPSWRSSRRQRPSGKPRPRTSAALCSNWRSTESPSRSLMTGFGSRSSTLSPSTGMGGLHSNSRRGMRCLNKNQFY